jgi:lysyl-tRNA synthetase class 2
VAKAFSDYTEISVDQALRKDCFDEILVEHIEPNLGLGRPCFLYDYPVALGSLARRKAADKDVAERFELYLCGVELANGFSELTDADEQRRRFEMELESSEGHRQLMPEQFLQDLQQMPEACGIALGLDRLVMLLVGEPEIDRVVSFTPEEL